MRGLKKHHTFSISLHQQLVQPILFYQQYALQKLCFLQQHYPDTVHIHACNTQPFHLSLLHNNNPLLLGWKNHLAKGHSQNAIYVASRHIARVCGLGNPNSAPLEPSSTFR